MAERGMRFGLLRGKGDATAERAGNWQGQGDAEEPQGGYENICLASED
jgi:hypothetical protein